DKCVAPYCIRRSRGRTFFGTSRIFIDENSIIPSSFNIYIIKGFVSISESRFFFFHCTFLNKKGISTYKKGNLVLLFGLYNQKTVFLIFIYLVFIHIY